MAFASFGVQREEEESSREKQIYKMCKCVNVTFFAVLSITASGVHKKTGDPPHFRFFIQNIASSSTVRVKCKTLFLQTQALHKGLTYRV